MVFPCPGADPCLNYHCKKGKVCELDEGNTPMCVCQDPSTCPPAEGEFEHVSGLSLDRIIQLSSFPWARPKTWSTANIKPEMKHLVFFLRTAALTIRPTRPPATSLPPSAHWREPRRATSCTWTTSDPANVSPQKRSQKI